MRLVTLLGALLGFLATAACDSTGPLGLGSDAQLPTREVALSASNAHFAITPIFRLGGELPDETFGTQPTLVNLGARDSLHVGLEFALRRPEIGSVEIAGKVAIRDPEGTVAVEELILETTLDGSRARTHRAVSEESFAATFEVAPGTSGTVRAVVRLSCTKRTAGTRAEVVFSDIVVEEVDWQAMRGIIVQYFSIPVIRVECVS